MLTEDYVSFETAKLLKEKGFEGQCLSKYNSNGCIWDNIRYDGRLLGNKDIFPQEYLAPTLQMAMKWLRKVHNKSIEIRSQGLKATSIGWIVEICNLVNQDEEFHHPYTFPTYEEACEAAIKYCLENLI